MKRITFLIIALLITAACTSYAADEALGYDDYDKAVDTNPENLSEDNFYEYESMIIRGSSGSGGYFLGEPEIQWILTGEKAFRAKGVELKDKKERHKIIGWSYDAMGEYKKAYDEFKSVGYQSGMEESEWRINNTLGIREGTLNLKEYDGNIPEDIASETVRVEDNKYLFIAYFKGPVCRYNKKQDKHALVYSPKSQYDWCDKLALDGKYLTIHLRDNAGTFIFDNATNELAQRLQ